MRAITRFGTATVVTGGAGGRGDGGGWRRGDPRRRRARRRAGVGDRTMLRQRDEAQPQDDDPQHDTPAIAQHGAYAAPIDVSLPCRSPTPLRGAREQSRRPFAQQARPARPNAS